MGVKPKVSAVAPPPDAPPGQLVYLWDWFWDLLAGAAMTAMSPAVITWADLSAWCVVNGETLERWEARARITLSSLRAKIITETKPRGDQNQV